MNYPKFAHQLFERFAVSAPERMALICGNEKISYAQLNARADMLALDLRNAGVKSDTFVISFNERGINAVISFLGILKSGGVYVPVDPATPPAKIKFVVSDTNAKFIVTSHAHWDVVHKLELQTFLLDDSAQATSLGKAARVATAPVTADPQPENLAYVIYTSGTTGSPKGVLIEHGALLNFITWRQAFYRSDQSDVFVFKANVSFDISIAEMLMPLTAGAFCIVVESGQEANLKHIMEIIDEHRVTRISLVPSMLERMLGMWNRCGSIVDVACGGDVLTRTLATRFLNTVDGRCRLHNLYGPTEATILASYYTCVKVANGSIPIGRPLPNTFFVIVDEDGNALPAGQIGELHIGGAGLARGYLNNAQLNRERFVCVKRAGETIRLYRTGDLARQLPGGDYGFIGRADTQVKIRGFRIELGGIESHIQQFGDIDSVAVVAKKAGDGDKLLVAYVVKRPDLNLSARNLGDRLQDYLKSLLPDYMIPRIYVLLPELPLTENGKVDRKGLSTREILAPGSSMRAPQTDTEKKLHAIWSRVLGTAAFGADDNFFEVGGHSLAAYQVLHLIQTELNARLTFAQLSENAVLAQLGRVIDQGASGPKILESKPFSENLAERILEIQQNSAAILREFNATGASIALYSGSRVHAFALGHGNVERQESMTVDARFRMSCFIKILVTYTVFCLVNEGKIRLSERVADWFPELLGPEFAHQPVLLRHLLSHTGGIDDSNMEFLGQESKTVDEFIAGLPRGLGMLSRPGDVFKYSPFGFLLLARVIEIVDACPWRIAVQRRVCDKLGIQIGVDEPHLGNHTRPDSYVFDPASGKFNPAMPNYESVPEHFLPAMSYSAAMSSRDWLEVLAVIARGGITADGRRLLSEVTVKAMTEVQIGVEGHHFIHSWAHGLLAFENGNLGFSTAAVGQHSCMMVDTRAQEALVIQTNSYPNTELIDSLSRLLMTNGGYLIQRVHAASPSEDCLGEYESGSLKISIQAEADALYLSCLRKRDSKNWKSRLVRNKVGSFSLSPPIFRPADSVTFHPSHTKPRYLRYGTDRLLKRIG